ncbi:hypothetical protein Tco_1541231 [Tanacetum coccineum]
MSEIVPPIPPHLGYTSSPNRVDNMHADNINNTTTNNVAQNIVDENLPLLHDLEEVLMLQMFLKNGPFVPLSSLSTSTNPLPKSQKQWSHADRRLANQDKRLKSIIISCLPNDVMKSVIKCTIDKAMWNDLILAHEGPSDTRDTKIGALRFKFNSFKALEGEKVNGTFTRMKCLLNDLENNGVSIPQAEESDSDVEEDTRSSSEFLADLIAKFHDRALLANQKRFYKRSGRVGSAKRPMHKSNETYFACGKLDYKGNYKGLKAEIAILTKKIDNMSKGKSEKGLVVESFDSNDESVSSEDERVTKVMTFMAIAEDELSVGKTDARSVPSNIVCALGGRGKGKEQISSKELMLTKADESLAETALEITSDFESECDVQEPLPPLPKLLSADPIGTSSDVLTLADLTQTPTVSKEVKKVTNKTSAIKAPKKKAMTGLTLFQPRKLTHPLSNCFFTLIEEVKGLKEQIKIPSDTYLSVSQLESSKSAKGKQKT